MTKISDRVFEFSTSKRLSVNRVTFLSPLKQMGLVSYKYRLIAKSHIRSLVIVPYQSRYSVTK